MSAVPLPLLAAFALSGCGGDTDTVYRDTPTDVPYVDDLSGAESFTANLIEPPEDADQQFEPATPPTVSGTTAR
ncbi:MAG: hypothetical protein ABJ319_04510 [Alloalcanivorax venustensis]